MDNILIDKLIELVERFINGPTVQRILAVLELPQDHQRAHFVYRSAGIAVIAFGIYKRDPIVLALGGLFLATQLLIMLYLKLSRSALRLDLTTVSDHAFPDQPVTLRLRLSNTGRIPFLDLWLQLIVPREVDVEGQSPIRHAETVARYRLSLQRRSERESIVRLSISRRGLHVIGPGQAEVSDPLKLSEHTVSLPAQAEVVVYPRLSPVALDVTRKLPIGTTRGRSLTHDGTRYLGSRPYQPGDGLRLMDWKQTATRDDLHVRTYETVASSVYAVFLDLTAIRSAYEGTNSALLEETISLTAGLIYEISRKGEAVGLFTAGIVGGSGGHGLVSVRMKPKTGPRHLAGMLDVLARIQSPGLFRRLPRILIEESERLDYGAHVVVVAPFLSPELAASFGRISRGRSIYFVATGRSDPELDGQLPAHVRNISLSKAQR